MKTILLSLILILNISLLSWAQTEQPKTDSVTAELTKMITDMLGARITMDIDTNFFKKQGPLYMAESSKVMIMTLLIPVPYEESKDGLDKQANKMGMKVKEKGEMQANGRTLMFKKGTFKKDGQLFYLELYAIPADAKRTIYLTGFYPKEAKENHGHLIQRAAVSAKLAL